MSERRKISNKRSSNGQEIDFNFKEKMLVAGLIIGIFVVAMIAGFFAIQYSSTRAQYERLQNDYNSLQNQLSTLENKEDELREKLQTAEEEEIPALQEELGEVVEKKQELQAKIQELQDKLELYENKYVRGFKLDSLYWQGAYRDIVSIDDTGGRKGVVTFTAGDYTFEITSKFRDSEIGTIEFDLYHSYTDHPLRITFKHGDQVAFVIDTVVEKGKWIAHKIEFNCRHSKFSFYRDTYTQMFNQTYQNDVSYIDTIVLNGRGYKSHHYALDLKYLEAFTIDTSA